jgi:high affinity Mn2+ porin
MTFLQANSLSYALRAQAGALLLTASIAAQVPSELPSAPEPRPSPTLEPAQQTTATQSLAPADTTSQRWNIHGQITETPQGDPPFRAKYSGPNSLTNTGEVQATYTSDLYFGARLWHGGEIHVDGLLWKGFGLSNDKGIEAFPNGDAFKLGITTPHFMFAHLFIRETIGLGGNRESVPDGPLTLASEQDISRLTFTVGRLSPTDMFDSNAYAQDAHSQFMNWATMTNLSWDFPADSVGYTTGIVAELNQPRWAVRYGFFQVPNTQNGFTADDQVLMFPRAGGDGPFFRAWGMAGEFERRYADSHSGAIRVLTFVNRANSVGYREATPLLIANGPGADLSSAFAYRCKYGFGLNWEQKITDHVGVFSRLGWNNGQVQGWMYNDSNWTASLGMSVIGSSWRRTNDVFGLAYIDSGASRSNQEFLAAGGTDILDGDGALTYGSEKVVETYYNFSVWKSFHVTPDYEFVDNPAFNRDRGPVSVFGVRLHSQF